MVRPNAYRTEASAGIVSRRHLSATSVGWGRAIASGVRLVMDMGVLASAPMIYALTGRLASDATRSAPSAGSWLVFASLSAAFLILTNGYSSTSSRRLARDSFRVLTVVAIMTGFMAVVTREVVKEPSTPVHLALFSGVLAAVLITSRQASGTAVVALAQIGIGYRRVVIVGDRTSIGPLIERLKSRGSIYRVVAVVETERGGRKKSRYRDIPVVNGVEKLPGVMVENEVTDVLIAASAAGCIQLRSRLSEMDLPGAVMKLALDPIVESPGVRRPVSYEALETADLRSGTLPWHYEAVKRTVDIAGASVLLLLLWPLMLLVAAAIKLDSKGPVFFKQRRVGRSGRTFEMFKFRSMSVNAEEMKSRLTGQNQARGPMFKIRDDPRVTRVGRVIRRLSLDEVPQLFNVVEGSMSLVGPRPPLPEEVKDYLPEHFQRLGAIPGCTGLWQVTRQSPTSSFDEMYWRDMAYISSWSPALDLVILARTIPAIVVGRGAA